MKFVIIPWWQNEDYLVVRAIPTTEKERLDLEILKYDLADDVYGGWEPQKLGYPLSCEYLDALGYPNLTFWGEDKPVECRFDPRCKAEGYQTYYDITAAPRDIEVMIAGYRLRGKHRKVARILKEVKRRNKVFNEEIIRNMDTWGYQVPYRTEEEEE